MSTILHDTLSARADRAPATPDLDLALADVRERVERARRRRRDLAAAGGGSLAIVALTVAVIALAPLGVPDTPSGSGPADRTATGPAPAGAGQTTPGAARQRRPAPSVELFAVPPAPASAPMSLGLVPAGYRFLATSSVAATYGPPGIPNPTDPDDFVGRIMVGANQSGTPLPPADFPLTIAGHAAAYRVTTDGGAQLVSLRMSSTITVDIQIPISAALTREQAIRIGDSLTIRDYSHHSNG